MSNPAQRQVMDFVWPVIGLCAVAVSAWLLYHELSGVSVDDVLDSLGEIAIHDWILAACSTLVAYGALAGYDMVALRHLGRSVPWPYVTLCSFTTYALAHNIGASVVSGAVVRYRAYTRQGLTGAEVGILVALCSFTFALGTVVLAGIILLIEPSLIERLSDEIPTKAGLAAGAVLVGCVALYVLGSWLGFRPLRIGPIDISYPKLPIVARQLIVGPLELIGAAGIIYFALPEAGNPGFVVVLGIFLASFAAALLSHAPGGLGVLEIVFIAGLPEMEQSAVLAALLVFRFFYLLVPLAISLVVVLLFERSQFLLKSRSSS